MEKRMFIEISLEELSGLVSEAVTKALAGLAPNQVKNQTLVTAKEACALLDVCKTTLWVWRRRGLVKARYLGRRVYFEREELLNAAKAWG